MTGGDAQWLRSGRRWADAGVSSKVERHPFAAQARFRPGYGVVPGCRGDDRPAPARLRALSSCGMPTWPAKRSPPQPFNAICFGGRCRTARAQTDVAHSAKQAATTAASIEGRQSSRRSTLGPPWLGNWAKKLLAQGFDLRRCNPLPIGIQLGGLGCGPCQFTDASGAGSSRRSSGGPRLNSQPRGAPRPPAPVSTRPPDQPPWRVNSITSSPLKLRGASSTAARARPPVHVAGSLRCAVEQPGGLSQGCLAWARKSRRRSVSPAVPKILYDCTLPARVARRGDSRNRVV